ncbi:Uncharacterised protein [Vibrio cholerae]|nr:Uncharacterised protein [Vibrio cholerae]
MITRGSLFSTSGVSGFSSILSWPAIPTEIKNRPSNKPLKGSIAISSS